MDDKIKSSEEIRRLMGVTQSEYSIAIRKLRDLEREKMIAEAKTTIILTSKTNKLITNKNLREHLVECCKDPKFKPTIDFISSCIYIEHQELMEEYNFYAKQAKQAEKEFEMLSSQNIAYQSERKFQGVELMNKV